jgi:tetratricopeptide (TPR) repeat protein/CHAT domain-containing protein
MFGRRGAWRLAAVAVAGLVCAMVLAGRSHAQPADETAALNAELARLYQAGKYAEAIEIAKRVIAIREKALGPDHPQVGSALNNLAALYRDQGRTSEAEPLLKRAIAIIEKALGPDHADVGLSLNNLAGLYYVQGRTAEAEPLFQRSLAIIEKSLGPDHPQVGQSLNNLAVLCRDQGRPAEAEPLLKRAIAIREKALGPDHPQVGQSLNNLAEILRAQVRTAEAEPLLNRAIAIAEKALGPDHRDVGSALNNLAALHRDQGRTAEAEPLLKRAIAIREKALGLDHPQVSESLNDLAEVYRAEGRTAEAEPLFRRAIAIAEKALGPDHPDVGSVLNNLAALYRDQGRAAEAEPLLKRAIAIREKALGPDHPQVGQCLNDLAALYRDQDRFAEAEALLKRAIAIAERAALGPDHPVLGATLNNLAGLYYAQDRFAEAEALLKRSLAIAEKALGPDHPDVGITLNNLAGLALAQGDWARAADYWRRSTGVIQRRTQRGLAGSAEGSTKGEAQRLGSQFASLVRMTHRLATQGRVDKEIQSRAMFETAQWAQGSEAAASLAQMAARSAKGSAQLSSLVRERQDLVGEWQARDKHLIAAKSKEPDKRNATAEKALADRLAAIDTRLAVIDARLAKDFPDYAALVSAAPASVPEVQAQLGADEALVLFFDTPEWKMTGSTSLPEESFIWVVTKTEVRWARSELGTAAVGREVAALRCGLDATAWDGDGARLCSDLLKVSLDKASRDDEPLPFDHARAYKLYTAMFGEVKDVINGKHLAVVPSGPLTQLPFHVLLTEAPSSAEHRSAAWLAREHAITILPAVSSLRALRRVGRPSAAPRPMFGIGNPLLDGPDARYASLAKQTQAKQSCPDQRLQRLAARSDQRAGRARVETRGGLANVSDIKGQVPLPETADELCAVARDLKAQTGRDILLGAKATEREVKRLSAAGVLAKYRMVHFATHGVLAGTLDGAQEPGLILTPPAMATEEDDGYLSASEIAALKLDADWVILSACNTAAGAATSAATLSGLARAFIYAQARALLVSHWAVDSDATVKLITGAVGAMARDAKVGRAEALRRSMLALIDKGALHEAHPAYWAPFVLVGEGQGK